MATPVEDAVVASEAKLLTGLALVQDQIHRDMQNMYTAVYNDLAATKQEILTFVASASNTVQTNTNRMVSDVISDIWKLNEAVKDGNLMIDYNINETEEQLRNDHQTIVGVIAETNNMIEMSNATTAIQITEGIESIHDNLNISNEKILSDIGDKASNTVFNLSDRISEGTDFINNNLLDMNISTQQSIADTQFRITDAVYTTGADTTASINRVKSDLGEDISFVSEQVTGLSGDIMLVGQYLWEQVREFILEHFDLSLDNMVKTITQRYKAETIAHRNLTRELEGK